MTTLQLEEMAYLAKSLGIKTVRDLRAYFKHYGVTTNAEKLCLLRVVCRKK